LRRYGGLSAYGRGDQLSDRFLSDELAEIGIMTTFIPTLFLAVASFLLYVVLSRLVATQRTEIGLLKAFGRSDLRVGLHYLLLAMATVAIGLFVGLPLGVYLGQVFVGVYKDYFHFPDLHLVIGPSLVLIATAVSMLAATLGALVSVRRAVALPPAEAMRPEPPANFRAGLMEWGGVTRRLPASLRMIARNLARRPWKAVLSVLGVALAVGLMVVGRFALDGAGYMMSVQFNQVQRAARRPCHAGDRAASGCGASRIVSHGPRVASARKPRKAHRGDRPVTGAGPATAAGQAIAAG
jgi:putative ABC transport system permease protein